MIQTNTEDAIPLPPTPAPPITPPPDPTPPVLANEPHTIFDKHQKALIVVIASIAATFSGFAGNSYFPALPTLADDFDVSIDLINLTVTSYLLFQGIAPSLWGPISDVKGRRVAYCFTFLVFLGACIGLAEARNYATLLVLRCVQSTGSASTIAIGSGVIGDITTPADRGGIMGIFQAGLLVPVAVGPVIGGALAGTLGWRSIFWFLAIYSGVFLVVLVLLLPETLRSAVGNGSQTPSNFISRYPLHFYQRTTKTKWSRDISTSTTSQPPPPKRIDVTGPFRILISKQAAPIIIYIAIYYTVWQMTITAMSTLFQERYGLNDTQIGLTFIGNGVGSIVGTLVTGKILNMDYKRVLEEHQASNQPSQAQPPPSPPNPEATTSTSSSATTTTTPAHPPHEKSPPTTNEPKPPLDFPLEKARLRLLPYISLIQCVSILTFGWTLSTPHKIHISIPILTTFITGWTAVSAMSIATTYLVDIFHDKSAAAGASLNLARCFLAAGGASFVMPLIHRVGVGWAFTAFVGGQVVALGALGVQMVFGGRWRGEASGREVERDGGG